MATKVKQIHSTLFFISILFNFLSLTLQDEPCPYPCYPPPTGPGGGGGGGSETPTTTTPSPPVTFPPPSESGSYTPPVGYNNNYPPTTPTGNLPNYPSPPYGYGNNYNNPPPPDPILPYFPFYYKKPLHGTDNQSSAVALGRFNLMIGGTSLLVFLFFL